MNKVLKSVEVTGTYTIGKHEFELFLQVYTTGDSGMMVSNTCQDKKYTAENKNQIIELPENFLPTAVECLQRGDVKFMLNLLAKDFDENKKIEQLEYVYELFYLVRRFNTMNVNQTFTFSAEC